MSGISEAQIVFDWDKVIEANEGDHARTDVVV
jgi:hypothetical protein